MLLSELVGTQLADRVAIGGLPSMIRSMPPWPATRSPQWTHLAHARALGGHKQTHIHPLGRHTPGTLNTLPLGMHTYRLTHSLGRGPYVCNWIARCPVFMYYWGARLIRKKMKRLIRDMLISSPLRSLERAGTGTVGRRKRGSRAGKTGGRNWVMSVLKRRFYFSESTFNQYYNPNSPLFYMLLNSFLTFPSCLIRTTTDLWKTTEHTDSEAGFKVF